MLKPLALQRWVITVFCCSTLFGQKLPTVPGSSGMRDFPVVLQQSVTAGKTPVGTVVQAKLEVASLVEGRVIPRNAVFSGKPAHRALRFGWIPYSGRVGLLPSKFS